MTPRSSVVLICVQAEEHSDMTTFTLLWGWFRYEVLPMGLKPLLDKFNNESNDCTRGLIGNIKSVDDVLQQAKSYRQLRYRLVVLFEHFRVMNVKVNSSKFRIGVKVKFGGFIAGVSENRVYL